MIDDTHPLTDGVGLRPAALGDAESFAEAYTRSRAYMRRWEPVRPDTFYTVDGQVRRLTGLLAGAENPRRETIPFNLVWRGRRVWLIPRAADQTALAATYIGALEMGGIFCLPSADEFRRYLPAALRGEVARASIAGEAELRRWVEAEAVRR